jgi:hypothetical protein
MLVLLARGLKEETDPAPGKSSGSLRPLEARHVRGTLRGLGIHLSPRFVADWL